jgi:hypothetical protein
MSAAALPLMWKDTSTGTRHTISPCAPFISVSINRLVDLLAENGEDDYGKKGPAQFAFWHAFKIMAGAVEILGEDFACSPSVDSSGGIRITWRRGDRQVKLVCPSTHDLPIYIYHSSPAGNGLQNSNVGPGDLARKLDWLINRDSASTT